MVVVVLIVLLLRLNFSACLTHWTSNDTSRGAADAQFPLMEILLLVVIGLIVLRSFSMTSVPWYRSTGAGYTRHGLA